MTAYLEDAMKNETEVTFDLGAREAVNAILMPQRGAEVMAAPPAPSPVAHPLGPPVVTGNNITVDMALQQPTRITRMIMDLTLQRFVADQVFASGGGVTGGAVIYDTVQANELYSSRDIERVSPGGEFPIITSDRLAPKVAEVEKWGGKVFITDEARDRNDSVLFANQIRQLGNTMVRKINARTIAELEAAVAANTRTIVGRNWATVTATGPDAGQTTAQNMPARDLALAVRQADTEELGVVYDTWLLNPQEYSNLIIAYGGAGLSQLLGATRNSVYVSNRVTPGTAYCLAARQVGQMRIEKAMASETWREQSTERTWVQTSVRPLFFVDNPFAVLKFTGLAG